MDKTTIKETTDKELISEYKVNADQQIIGELYDRYSRLVFGSCLKYLKDRQLAEDAVNDIFVQISKKLATHNVEYFKSWLYTVTRNHCIEILRKVNRHRDKKNASELMYTEAVFHPDDIEDTQTLTALAQCLKALPTNQQKCIKLFLFDALDGYSNQSEAISDREVRPAAAQQSRSWYSMRNIAVAASLLLLVGIVGYMQQQTAPSEAYADTATTDERSAPIAMTTPETTTETVVAEAKKADEVIADKVERPATKAVEQKDST